MSATQPKVSIIIATYQPGDGLNRVIDSIDRQTLPQDEFEVIFVDDGSPDETFARLQQLEEERANVRVFRIENSGWPSRPRNIGIAAARGEYLMFMDHDDSLFPDGLRRSYEYAVETNADVLSPKESKTNDKWWGMSSLRLGNLTNIVSGDGIQHMLPLVPHKFYRRQMFMDHDIRFPEGSRVLWEDQFINVDAYRHANVIAVLADTPVYLWHASDTNSSHTFDPARDDFWDRLNDLMSHISKALNSRRHRDARRFLLAMHLRVRVIDRMVRLLVRDESGRSAVALRRARRLLRRYGTADVIAAMPRKHRIQARFLRKGRRELLVAFHEQDLAGAASVQVASMRWRDGVLHLEVETVLEPKEPETPILRRSGERVFLAAPAELTARLPDDLLDVTDQAQSMSVEFVIRSRRGHVTWSLPSRVVESEFAHTDRGLGLRTRSVVTLDVRTAAVGHALDDNVWDAFAETDWLGMMRLKPVACSGPARPGLVDGRPVVPYANNSGALSIDLAGWLRSLVSDAAPAEGQAGRTGSVDVSLTNLESNATGRLPLDSLSAVPEDRDASREKTLSDQRVAEVGVPLHGVIVVNDAGARLTGTLAAAQGRHRLYASRDDVWHRTRHSIIVDEDGSLQWVVDP